MQKDTRNKLRVIACASHVLNAAEFNYSTIIWSMKHFKDIIQSYNIRVKIDHVAVVQLFDPKNLSGRHTRWQLTNEDFQPQFEYLPGKANTLADSLSRNIAPNSCHPRHGISELLQNNKMTLSAFLLSTTRTLEMMYNFPSCQYSCLS